MPSRFYDHQVHVQNHIAGLADRLHNTHAIGQRRNEHTVHHIDMKIFRASIFYRFNLLPKPHNIGCQN